MTSIPPSERCSPEQNCKKKLFFSLHSVRFQITKKNISTTEKREDGEVLNKHCHFHVMCEIQLESNFDPHCVAGQWSAVEFYSIFWCRRDFGEAEVGCRTLMKDSIKHNSRLLGSFDVDCREDGFCMIITLNDNLTSCC